MGTNSEIFIIGLSIGEIYCSFVWYKTAGFSVNNEVTIRNARTTKDYFYYQTSKFILSMTLGI